MPTIYPERIFNDEAGSTSRRPRSYPGHGPKSPVYPAPAGLERRHAAPRLTPTQWLAQWCCLDEQT